MQQGVTEEFEAVVETADADIRLDQISHHRLSLSDPCDSTVFVVDDDEQVRESLRLLMQSMDMFVRTFASADEFLAAYGSEACGCLVVDVHMPGISGIELLERLDAQGISIPTIVISGYRDVRVEQRVKELGVLDFVKKPFDPKALLAQIKNILSEKK